VKVDFELFGGESSCRDATEDRKIDKAARSSATLIVYLVEIQHMDRNLVIGSRTYTVLVAADASVEAFTTLECRMALRANVNASVYIDAAAWLL